MASQRHALLSRQSIDAQPLLILRQADPDLSIWRFASTPSRVDTILLLCIVVALAFVVYGGRLLATIHAICILSTYSVVGILGNGGDNFLRIVLTITPFLITDAYYSPRSDVRRQKLAIAEKQVVRIHNVALCFVVWQTCLVYASASIFKWSSGQWRSGTALYYSMKQTQFAYFEPVADLLAVPAVSALVTYTVLLAQSLFAPSVISRRFAAPVIAIIALMHIGIATGMGLVGFAFALLAGDAVCVPEHHYVRLGRVAQSGGSRVREWLRRQTRFRTAA